MAESNTLAYIEKIHSVQSGIEDKIYKDEKSNRYIGLESGHLQKIPKIEGEVTGDLKTSLINGIAQYTRDNVIDSIDKVKISLNDTTADYLFTKLVAGTNITLTENNDGVNETLTISDTTTVGHVIREEGVDLTQRANLNFIGTAITATDNAGTNSTDITVVIPADFITSISDTGSINLTVAAGALTADVLPAGIDHGTLADLLTDDHTQYALLAGRVGGQTFISGTGVNDPLRLRSTSGIGASGADIIFQVGNNGAIEAMRILNDGSVGIGTAIPTAGMRLDVVGDGHFGAVGRIVIGDVISGATSYAGLWIGNPNADITPSITNYAFLKGSTETIFNTPGGHSFAFRIGNSNKMVMLSNGAVGIGNDTPPQLLSLIDGNIESRFNTASSATELLFREGAVLHSEVVAIGSAFATVNRRNFLELFSRHSLGGISFWTNSGTVTEKARFIANGNLGLGTTTPTAVLHIKAGTATAETAPLKFNSGTNLTTPENGAIEYNGTNFFATRTGAVREGIITQSAVSIVSPTAPNRTITVNIDGTTYYLSAKTTND